jgi:alpha-tubulin suppressor-like RCC1 family protein
MIAAGCVHSLAVSNHGQLYGWGFNAFGQIGDGTTTDRDTPVKVSLGSWVNGSPKPRVVSLFGGLGRSLALLSDSVLLAWGNNLYGQLGDGTGNNSYVAVQVAVPGGTKVAAIAAGGLTAWP